MPEINTIAILGANGTVGSQVARLLVSLVDVKVFLVCRTLAKAQESMCKILTFLPEDTILGQLIPIDYSCLQNCIPYCDWIFESVTEDISIKQGIFKQIIPFLQPATLISTGTSSFLVKELTASFDVDFKKRFYGTHFFNPPDKLALLEFIQTEWNDPSSSLMLERFFRKQLERKTVKVRDVHGFIANRIGSLFLLEAAFLAEQHADRGGIGYIDALMGRFTGRSLPPLMTIDYIGLDVFAVMLDNVCRDINSQSNGNQRLTLLNGLLGKGFNGRKSGRGMYSQVVLSDGTKERWVFDLKDGDYRLLQDYSFPFTTRMIELQMQGDLVASFKSLVDCMDEEATLCKYLLLRYIAISCRVVQESAYCMEDVDIAMEDGYAWISPRKIVSLIGGSKGIQKVLDSNGTMGNALTGLDVAEFDIFQKPIEETDYRFFSHARK